MINRDNNVDDHVDKELLQYLTEIPPKSFFLFAGAGSGKTGSLVRLLKEIRKIKGQELWLKGQKIAIITYTNAACDEIKQRLEYNNLFVVQTIHSFVWDLIRHYTNDIRNWLQKKLNDDIVEQNKKEASGRKGSGESLRRQKKIKQNLERINELNHIKKFIYDPNGKNEQKNALNHNEVIDLVVNLLMEKTLLQKIFVQKYPILLIDESQDTNKNLIDAFFKLKELYKSQFALGLFGDTMQRIYFSGKENLGDTIPEDWQKPQKIMNHRSQKRIVDLINQIRKDIDNQKQCNRTDKNDGIVHFFIFSTQVDRVTAEKNVEEHMQMITNDTGWKENKNYECLILEHQMASQRLAFNDFFFSLHQVQQYKNGILDGSLSEIKLFTKELLPLIEAIKKKDKFVVAEIVKKHSPLFNTDTENTTVKISVDQLRKAKEAVEEISKILNKKCVHTCKMFIDSLINTNLFKVPNTIHEAFCFNNSNEDESILNKEELTKICAWKEALNVPIIQVQNYADYINGKTLFATHHGVKGLEYPRVMAIMDDESSKGSSFSYEKLFGIKEGNNSSILNTKRLFYVICSRAKESLALVAYTNDPVTLKKHLIECKWFSDSEISVNIGIN